MADRRSFLGAVSGAAVAVVLAKGAQAQSAPDKPSPKPASSPAAAAPKPSASPKPPSAAARAQAEAMRAFDPKLTDAELDTIARGIDGNDRSGQKLNKKGRVLKNGDEPVTRFAVDAVR
jgi:hypothetical protein